MMARAYKIPLQQGVTDQTLSVELGGNPYKLRVLWNERYQYHALSIGTLADELILENVKMVRDYPLIGRYQDARLPSGELIWLREKGKAEYAGYDDPEVTYGLYYYEPDVVTTPLAVTTNVVNGVIGSEWDSEWDNGLTEWDK